MSRRAPALLAALWLAACAGVPAAQPGAGVLWGYVKLVPKQGSEAASGSYGDRRLRDAVRVDYSQPGFAVVFAELADPEPGAPAHLEIEAGSEGPRLVPLHAAVTRGGQIQLENGTPRAVAVSAPGADFVATLAPGERRAFEAAKSGELPLHLLGSSSPPALVWVSPGPFAIADASGRYVLGGLAAGPVQLRAWHPRLPPSAPHAAFSAPGQVTRLDLEIGVDRAEEGAR